MLIQSHNPKHLEETVEVIRSRFGKRSIYPAILIGDLMMPLNTVLLHELIMPGVLGG